MSVLFSVATLALIYRYAKSAKVRLAWVPILVYAVSSVGIRYAYNARPYAMVSFLIVLALILAREIQMDWRLCGSLRRDALFRSPL